MNLFITLLYYILCIIFIKVMCNDTQSELTLMIGSIYSGSEFNNLTKDKHFVRLTNENENHNGFQYKTGLNIDIITFNPIGECNPGGLYFCEFLNFPSFLEYNNKICKNIRKVKIPDDARIYIENNKYKTNKFILEEAKDIYSDSDLCLKVVKHNGIVLNCVKEQTYEICLEAVKQNGLALQYVKEQTREICLEAVKQNGLALQYVKEQTREICLEAVKQNGFALDYVKEQTLEICLEAVKENGYSLYYVKEQTREICLTASKHISLILCKRKWLFIILCKRTNKRDMFNCF